MNAERPSDGFEGKTAVVSGAGSGIGRATALRLAREGAKVVATDISSERLDALRDEHPELSLATVAGDVSAPTTADELLAAAGGGVDVLVNNAGIMDSFLPAGEVDDETWSRVFDVNVTAAMRLSRAVLPGMTERGGGTIVNVTSEAGLRGSAAGAAYTASKHAVVGLTRHIAFMYGPQGVRCNAVAPGAVATNIQGEPKSEFAMGRIMPVMGALLPPMAQPEQLAAAICWLAGPDSANVNGAILPSDGGWSVA